MPLLDYQNTQPILKRLKNIEINLPQTDVNINVIDAGYHYNDNYNEHSFSIRYLKSNTALQYQMVHLFDYDQKVITIENFTQQVIRYFYKALHQQVIAVSGIADGSVCDYLSDLTPVTIPTPYIQVSMFNDSGYQHEEDYVDNLEAIETDIYRDTTLIEAGLLALTIFKETDYYLQTSVRAIAEELSDQTDIDVIDCETLLNEYVIDLLHLHNAYAINNIQVFDGSYLYDLQPIDSAGVKAILNKWMILYPSIENMMEG